MSGNALVQRRLDWAKMIDDIPVPIQIIIGFSQKKRWMIAAVVWGIYSIICILLGSVGATLPILGVWIIAVGLLSGVILGGRNIFLFVPLLFTSAIFTVIKFNMASPELSIQFWSRVIIVLTPGIFTGVLSSLLRRLIKQQRTIQAQNNILADVNEQLQEAYLKAESANRLKGEFISTMSHELRTPLNAIIGYSDLLLENYYGDLNTKQHQSITKLQTNGQQLLGIVNGILDFSVFESGSLELKSDPVYIKTLVANLRDKITPLADAKNLDFEIHSAPNVPPVFAGDEHYLTLLFMHLLTNAVKFTETGKISLCISLESEQLKVAVKDTGIGIPAEAHDSIFEPFWQVDSSYSRQHGGAGMGLAFVHGLVKIMSGHIDVESQEGSGSTFIVMLPLEVIQQAKL